MNLMCKEIKSRVKKVSLCSNSELLYSINQTQKPRVKKKKSITISAANGD